MRLDLDLTTREGIVEAEKDLLEFESKLDDMITGKLLHWGLIIGRHWMDIENAKRLLKD
jgi:hypothetical protein